MAAQFQFVMRSGPNTGKIFPLEAPEIIIGREASNGVAINDAEISRKHAKLSLHGSAYVIQDLGSTNGSFVNGQRITGTQVLNPGDTVSFGENIVLIYEAAQDPNATVISSAQAPKTLAPARKPASAPAPTPSPVQAQVYSGQVPGGPTAGAPLPAKKGGSKAVLFIVIVVIVLLCLCVAVPFIADALKMDCVVPFKWFFNIVGPLFGYSSCP
jgi:hypothetical protein